MNIYKVWVTEPRVGKYFSCTENTIESENIMITLTEDGLIKDIFGEDGERLHSIKEMAMMLGASENEITSELRMHLNNSEDSIFFLCDTEVPHITLSVNRKRAKFDKTDMYGIYTFINDNAIETYKVPDYVFLIAIKLVPKHEFLRDVSYYKFKDRVLLVNESTGNNVIMNLDFIRSDGLEQVIDEGLLNIALINLELIKNEKENKLND